MRRLPTVTAEPSIRVLLVGWDRAQRTVLRRSLARACGNVIATVVNQPEGLRRRLAAGGIDLVMTDDMTAWGDALWPLRETKRIAGDVPVIVFTRFGSVQLAVAAMKAGADDYVIDDPAGRARLGTAIQTAIEAARHRSLARTTLRKSGRGLGASISSILELAPRATPELTAADVCEAVVLAIDPASVAVLAFDGHERLAPLAFVRARASGPPLLPSDGPSIRNILERIRPGPWVDEGIDGGVILVPLGLPDRPLGLLAVAMDAHGDGPLDPMPIVLEIAVVARALLIDELMARADRADIRESLTHIVAERAFMPVFQPIVDLATDDVIGYEALTRFADGSEPEYRFQEARRASFSIDLELATMEAAIGGAALLPRGRWLGLNVSPDLLLATDRLRPLLSHARQRVVLEVARGERIEDHAAVRSALERLGPEVDLAVGEGGDGSSSLSRILELTPDFIKLDMDLIRRVDTDPARQALIAGLVHFAGLSGCRLVAQGIASEAERRALRTLGVRIGQGHLLGRPTSALRHTRTVDARARQTRQHGQRPASAVPAKTGHY